MKKFLLFLVSIVAFFMSENCSCFASVANQENHVVLKKTLKRNTLSSNLYLLSPNTKMKEKKYELVINGGIIEGNEEEGNILSAEIDFPYAHYKGTVHYSISNSSFNSTIEIVLIGGTLTSINNASFDETIPKPFTVGNSINLHKLTLRYEYNLKGNYYILEKSGGQFSAICNSFEYNKREINKNVELKGFLNTDDNRISFTSASNDYFYIDFQKMQLTSSTNEGMLIIDLKSQDLESCNFSTKNCTILGGKFNSYEDGFASGTISYKEGTFDGSFTVTGNVCSVSRVIKYSGVSDLHELKLAALENGTYSYRGVADKVEKGRIENNIIPNGIHNGHEYVDLGIVVDGKKVLWAKTNLGAAIPADKGDYYAWGETESKKDYSHNTYKYWSHVRKADANGFLIDKDVYENIGDDISGNPRFDAARAKWGGNWRMPTKTELVALKEQCKLENATMLDSNGKNVQVLKISSKRDETKFITLPYAGIMRGSELYVDYFSKITHTMTYMSSKNYDEKYNWGFKAHRFNETAGIQGEEKYYGQSIRPVFTMP